MNTWDKIYQKNIDEKKTENKDVLSHIVLNEEILSCRVLDMGCGFGEDAIYLNNLGNTVYATDYSEVGISHCEEQTSEVCWLVHDFLTPQPFKDNFLDHVSSFFSLHYFTDEELDYIFSEVKRILKPHSRFVYSVKLQEQNHCDTGKKILGLKEHEALIERWFGSNFTSEIKEVEYCGNLCKALTFKINVESKTDIYVIKTTTQSCDHGTAGYFTHEPNNKEILRAVIENNPYEVHACGYADDTSLEAIYETPEKMLEDIDKLLEVNDLYLSIDYEVFRTELIK